MTTVENKKTLHLLTRRFMKNNHSRNLIAILAIALTTLMLTCLLCGSSSLILSSRATEIRQSMCSSHAIAQNLTEKELEASLKALKDNKSVKAYGTGTFLGTLYDKTIPFQTEIRSGDGALAEFLQCTPTDGRLQ